MLKKSSGKKKMMAGREMDSDDAYGPKGPGLCVRNCDGMPRIADVLPPPKINIYSDQNSPMPSTVGSTRSHIDSSPNPVPYIFRIQAPPLGRYPANQQAKSPPFCLQLDHTIAVLWCLFRNKKMPKLPQCNLGVGQLQWALYFLKGIKPPNGGDRAEDVNIAIQAVEDALLNLYADMSNVVLRTPKDISSAKLNSTYNTGGMAPGKMKERPCTECNRQRELQQPKPEEPKVQKWNLLQVPYGPCAICSSATLASTRGDGRPRRSGGMKEDANTSSKYATSEQAPASLYSNVFFSVPTQAGSYGATKSDWQSMKREPRNELANFRQFEWQTLKRESRPKLQKEIVELKKTAAELSRRIPDGGSSPKSQSSWADLNRETMYAMMQNWRKEQLGRVETELRRLRSLDSAMGLDPDVTEVKYNKNQNPNTHTFDPSSISPSR